MDVVQNEPQYTAYRERHFRVIADKARFTLKIETIEIHQPLELVVHVAVGVVPHQFILLLQHSNSLLSEGLAQFFLMTEHTRGNGVGLAQSFLITERTRGNSPPPSIINKSNTTTSDPNTGWRYSACQVCTKKLCVLAPKACTHPGVH